MNRIFLLMVLMVVVVVSVSQAQLINHNRRERSSSIQTKVTQDVAMISKDFVDPIFSMMESQPKVSSRVERIYDMNKDGNLQRDEVVDFLGDVIRAVDRRGRFAVTAGVLVVFDKNKDNEINQSEARYIRKYLD